LEFFIGRIFTLYISQHLIYIMVRPLGSLFEYTCAFVVILIMQMMRRGRENNTDIDVKFKNSYIISYENQP